MKAVKDYPLLKNVTDVRTFLGLAQLYHKLVQNYAAKAKQFTELTNRSFGVQNNKKLFKACVSRMCWPTPT
jgi:hypothetical protein